MKEIRLTRAFLRKPINSILILLSIVLLIEALSWSIGYDIKAEKVQKAGGFLYYISLLVRSLVLPEFVTLFVTITLINRFHQWLKLNTVANNWRSIVRYQVKLLPILLLAFWVFNPITQIVRYLLTRFPDYSISDFWETYLHHTLSWSVYFTYLFPVLVIGYAAINISLLKDYLTQRREAQELAEAEATEASRKMLALSASLASKAATSSSYLSYLKGKNAIGELDFPISDVYYFTIEERFYYAELAKGRYLVPKTLNELENELDPSQFFRIKRDYIVNRHAVLNYAYWENGKYIVRLNTPEPYDIVVPRARMQEFREWLQHADKLQSA